MNVKEQIKKHLAGLPGPKGSEMRELHRQILRALPRCKLWFSDGKNSQGKTVSNPQIGYGSTTLHYADGKTREFFQIGLSANTAGISVYVMGLKDKKTLPKVFGKRLGKASVTGYCIKFKTLKDVNVDALIEAVQYGADASNEKDKK